MYLPPLRIVGQRFVLQAQVAHVGAHGGERQELMAVVIMLCVDLQQALMKGVPKGSKL